MEGLDTTVQPPGAGAETYLSQRLAAGQGEQVTPSAPQNTVTEIPQDIQTALIDLATRYEQQCDWLTRGLKKQIMEGEEFWKGNHYGIWSERDFRYFSPGEFSSGTVGTDSPRYDYVSNHFRQWGLISIAAVTRKVPKVRAKPSSARNEKDIATAKAFDKIANLIERNNKIGTLIREEGRLLYVQGGFGAYCRFVRSEDYGVTDEPIVEQQQVPLQEEGFSCPVCGEFSPTQPTGLGPSALPVCQACGTPLSEANYQQAEFASAPVVTGYKQVPKGQEKITIHGLLTLKLLPWANNQEESPYLINASLHPASAIRAAWPLRANMIGMDSDGSDGVSSTEDTRDARYQASLAAPPQQFGAYASTGMTLRGMVLLKQCWIRNWGFWECQDQNMVKKLLKLFPDGVHFNYIGKTFLNGENENLDKFWKICIGPLGNGIYRGGTGQDSISVNKRINDVANIQQEYVEHAAFPTVFADARFINMEGWMSRRQEAGSIFPIHPEHGGNQVSLKDMMYQPTQRLDGNIYGYGASLEQLGQQLTGALPSVFGGGIEHNETLGGYSQAREDALGRLQLLWKSVREFHAELMLIAVECFRANRTEDAELTVVQKSGEFASEFIRLDEIQGNITVEPEVDEDFPSTTGELRKNISELLTAIPEFITPILANPSNVDFVKRVLGSPDLIIPAEAAREKTFRDIFRLCQEKPVGWEPGPDGQMLAIPSVMPEMFIDDHITAIAVVQEWCRSSDPGQGIETKQTNPEAYANVVGFMLLHISQMQQEGAIMNPQPVEEEVGDDGAPEEGGPPPAK